MKYATHHQFARNLALTLTLLSALGCSLHKANKAFAEGRYDEAVNQYREVLKRSPTNATAKMGYKRSATLASELHMDKSREAAKRGQKDLEYQEVRQAVVLDTTNSIALDRLNELDREIQEAQAKDGQNIEEMLEEVNSTVPVLLEPRSWEPMNMNFSRKTSLREVFANLSKSSGVNIIMHSTFQDAQINVDLTGMPFQQVLETLMLQNELIYKIIDKNTILVVKDSPSNRDKYENQSIQIFHLSHADPNDVRTVINQLMGQSVKLFTDKRQNAVTVKARQRDLLAVQRIVSGMDKAKPEVMIYMELLEVTQSNMEKVGLLPVGDPRADTPYKLGISKDMKPEGNQFNGGINIKKADLRFLLPSLAIDALKQSSDAKMVASPNVRVISGEEGMVNIGDKVSVKTTSFGMPGMGSSTGSSGMGSYMPGASSDSFAYEDVGVQIKVKPRVHHNTDITIDIDSQVTTQKAGSGGSGRPDMGQRKIKTQARLKDGETAIFAGLLKEDEQKSLQGIWGLTDIPFLGKLFGSNARNKGKTDVLLTIRAVVVRKPELTAKDLEAFDPDLARTKDAPFTPEGKRPHPDAEGAAEQANPDRPSSVTRPENTQPLNPLNPAQSLNTKPLPAPSRDLEASPSRTPAANLPIESAPAGNLRLFVAPVFSPLGKGEQIQLTLNVSNGGGLSSGNLDLRIDPKLKLLKITAGDFLLGEGGTLDQTPAVDGLVKLNFKRTSTGSDSGTLATIELQGVTPGNAPVLIQGGRYMVGTKPTGAQVVNSLITVQ